MLYKQELNWQEDAVENAYSGLEFSIWKKGSIYVTYYVKTRV